MSTDNQIVKVSFPDVQKVQYTHQEKITDKTTLEDVRKTTFTGFWKALHQTRPDIEAHGTYKAMTLWDDENNAIDSDKAFRARLAKSTQFQAIFDGPRHEVKKEEKKA